MRAEQPAPVTVATSPHGFNRVVGTVCIGAFMAALDASIVSIALPTLHVYFHTTLATINWVAIAYLLALSSLLLIFGRLADHLGRSRMYAFGFLVFIVGSAACGAAPDVAILIVSRVVQASGAAMLQANSVALVTQYTPAESRGRAIGIQGAAQALGLSAGPAVGGALLALFSWRALFYVNVPIGILGTLLALRMLPKDTERAPFVAFDTWGSVLIVIAMMGIIWPLNEGYRLGWTSPLVWGSVVVGLGAAWAFLIHERIVRAPLLDSALFRNFTFSTGNLSGMLSFTLMYGAMWLAPFQFRDLTSLPLSIQGLALTPVPIAMSIMSPIAGRIADRRGAKGLTIAGMAVGAAGAVVLALTTASSALLFVMVGLALVGAGMGLFTAPNNASVMGVVDRGGLSSAGGFLNMARSVGMGLGAAVASSLYAGVLIATIGSDKPTHAQAAASSHALMAGYIGIGLAAAVAAIISAARPRTRARAVDGAADLA